MYLSMLQIFLRDSCAFDEGGILINRLMINSFNQINQLIGGIVLLGDFLWKNYA